MIDAEEVVKRSKIVMRYHFVIRNRKRNYKDKTYAPRMYPTPPARNPLALLPKRRLRLTMKTGSIIGLHSIPFYGGLQLVDDYDLSRTDHVIISRKERKIVTLGYLTHVMMEAGYAIYNS